ncbi:MAG: CoB--CoM heterodisulfide reductase iron-sulfur subunit A family protein [Deltaproteobacteria bacterium]|nr:CoB--CoM heterodisulfide reductase iron-sulfur subunit A family protein [Deltaproteobacteria bacterium]
MTERIGVYVCECGPNIKDAIDLDEVVKFAKDLEDVVLARPFGLLCSQEGKTFIEKEIQEHNLSRVVIAACSPKEHEHTFRKVLEKSGLNPFALQIANIREQCAWVTNDKVLATEKAKALIAAAIRRVVLQEPLTERQIECQSDVLVVGAGIAGISAALTLAQKERKVYLVERLPSIGGKVARYEDLFPSLECASCVLDPIQDEVLHNEQIDVLALSEIEEVLGYYGNFIVKVRKKARFVDVGSCIGCGACFEVCPVKVRNEYNEGLDERKAVYIPYPGSLPNLAVIDKEHCLRFNSKTCSACQEACPFGSINYGEEDTIEELKVGAIVIATGFDLFDPGKVSRYGYGDIENVYTSLEFERLISSTGPTEGKLLLKNSKPPEKIALVHCVGSRSMESNEHCSGVCCTYLSKFAHQAKEKLPDVEITQFFSDLCLPGKEAQVFFNKVSSNNEIEFIRLKSPDSLDIFEQGGKALVRYTGAHEEPKTAQYDMVVLAPAMVGATDAARVAAVYDIAQGKAGFFSEEDTTLYPVASSMEGIFVAGCAQGPKDIGASVAQGQAAAGKILSRLVPGEKLALEAAVCEIDEGLCSGCKTCIGLCSYNAMTFDDKEKCVSINEVLCRGCGTCVAACPSGVIKAKHFTDRQMFSEIEGLLRYSS